MKGKKQEPNYDLLLYSNVSYVRTKLAEYKKAKCDFINCIHISDDGSLMFASNMKELSERVTVKEKELQKAFKSLADFKEFLKEREKENL